MTDFSPPRPTIGVLRTLTPVKTMTRTAHNLLRTMACLAGAVVAFALILVAAVGSAGLATGLALQLALKRRPRRRDVRPAPRPRPAPRAEVTA
jgi:hypothetical protein